MTELEVKIRVYLRDTARNSTKCLQRNQTFLSKEELKFIEGYRDALFDTIAFLNSIEVKNEQ